MLKVSGDFVRNGLLGDQHSTSLHFLVALIHRIFLVNLDQAALVVVNLLPKAQRPLLRVNFLQIARSPTVTPEHIEPVMPATIRQLTPLPNFFSF